MNLHSLRRPQKPWALCLVLALLLLTGWGQVHRVMHPGATAATVLADAHHGHGQPALHAGHEAGGGLCLLLDHLADGTATLPPLLLVTACPAVPALPEPRAQGALAAEARPFDARGPPVFA